MDGESMSGETISGAVLDHVAHAVPSWQAVWDRYVVDLGAEWSSGGPGTGFAPAQLRFGNGARIELLMPWAVEENDFLQRFITANGPGPHHLTFKVPDLAWAIDQATQFGFDPIGIDFSDPEWMEAFIHPKQATGVVVQMAEAPTGWSSPPPDDFPTGRRQRRDGSVATHPGSLRRVVHAVADLEVATSLFVGLLGGRQAGQGQGEGQRWIDLEWDGPLALRLVSPTTPAPSPVGQEPGGPVVPEDAGPLWAWLGSRAGRIHHVQIEADEPESVSGARPLSADDGLPGLPGSDEMTDGVWVIEPESNAGLRLVLHRL
jgi:Glyoxalase/Bleomycin resistance protein/Dioxygenase superfamily